MSNAQKAKPGIELTLGEKTLTLVFDLWALVQVERKTGKTVSQLLETGSMEGVLTMLWAAMHNKNPEITEEEVGHMVDMKDFNYISRMLGEALSQSTPDEEDGAEVKNEESQPSGTGLVSGQ